LGVFLWSYRGGLWCFCGVAVGKAVRNPLPYPLKDFTRKSFYLFCLRDGAGCKILQIKDFLAKYSK
jgi:hypothetical protein